MKVYSLVCTNYVTKWVEAKALPKATEQAVADVFLFEEIFVLFGVLREIVTDQGAKALAQEKESKEHNSLPSSFDPSLSNIKFDIEHPPPYNPKANGQLKPFYRKETILVHAALSSYRVKALE